MDSSNKKIDFALDLMRRMPPQKIDQTIMDLIALAPDCCEDLLSGIDQPLRIAKDTITNKEYLLSDFNRDGDSYRSPWSNTYDPPLEDGALPSENIRQLEIEFNNAFERYREMYYDGGISSVFMWDTNQGLAVAVLIKKAGNVDSRSGCWESIHIIHILEFSANKNAVYNLTSTVMLWLRTQSDDAGYFNLGGSITRSFKREYPVTTVGNSHLVNCGRMVEEMENTMRSSLIEIYFGTTKNILNSMRTVKSASEEEKHKQLVKEVHTALLNKSQSQG